MLLFSELHIMHPEIHEQVHVFQNNQLFKSANSEMQIYEVNVTA